MEQKSFLKGALILSIAGIISKLLGALYRIPFARLVGDEGVGLYQMAYPFYTMILAVSTAGIPLAVSKLIAERHYQKDEKGIARVFWLSMTVLLITGAAAAVGLYYSADFIANNILKEPRAALSLKAIAPAILFTSSMATLRGYFQGFQTMTPTALSQVFEQIIRVTTVFFAALYLLPLGVEYAAAGATFGAATGGLAGLVLLWIIYFINNSRKNKKYQLVQLQESNLDLVKQIIYLAVPISIGGLVLPLMQTMDTFLVPLRLQAAGFTVQEATGLYGQLSGMAGAIINLPFIITTALAASLVPAVAESLASGRLSLVRGQFSSALLLALVIVLPATVGLMVLARPICQLLYNQPEAGIPLAWLAPTVLAVGIYQTSTATLQGLGKPLIPVMSLFLGAIIKGVLTFYLTAVPSLGVKGAALATVIGFLAAAFRNLIMINKYLTSQWLKVKEHLLKPAVSVTVMGFAVVLSYQELLKLGIRGEISTLAAISLGALSYFLILILIGGIKASDIKKVPKIGPQIAYLLKKFRLARD
ncbi:MAG: putative polysaccharide biosynthesis protein [Peptococcaceae bacterium]